VAEARGNPLALLELPRGLSPAQLAGGFGLPGAVRLAGRIGDSFTRQLDALADQTRLLLLLTAADPSGDQALVGRAAARLGIRAGAGTPTVPVRLVEFGTHVRFRHPLVRSAVYRSASHENRRAVHAALAEVTDPIADPDRRAWHQAQAAAGPDEEVAVALEQSAGRAQRRGGVAAAAALLERSAALSADPAQRTGRALAAAEASVQAGAFGTALDLLATVEANRSEPLDELTSAQVDLLRGRIALASDLGRDAPSLLLKAANRFLPLNLGLAREAYLAAWSAASLTGPLASGGDVREVSRAASDLPALSDLPRPVDLLLDGLTRLVIDGPAAAVPTLRRAVHALAAGEVSKDEGLRWGWIAATVLWDDDAGRAIISRQVQLAREIGALERMPADLVALAMSDAWRGDFAAAASLIAEADAIADATGIRLVPGAHMFLASLRDNQDELASLIAVADAKAAAEGGGGAATYAQWATAISHNGRGRYAEAFEAARRACEHGHPYASKWALPELIEAAVHTGDTQVAAGALKRLAETTQPCGTDFALGIEARCRALLSQDVDADELYREAIGRLGRAGLRPELARARLLYGEWLRRQGRRVDAREQLRTAHDMLAAIGMTAFAERARHELTATGETVRKRSAEIVTTLTAQEALIARLARDGRTNPEIGIQLFLSARTVEWHLRKIFTKLGISSRRDLRVALAQVA
jgi:DNA-binding CsgD family transcriptional regulator